MRKSKYQINANSTIYFLKHDLVSVLRNNFFNLSEIERSILKEFITYLINDADITHSKSKSQLGQDFLP